MSNLESIVREYRKADSEKTAASFPGLPLAAQRVYRNRTTLRHEGEEERFRQQLDKAIWLEAPVILRASCMMRSGRVVPKVAELG